MIKSTNPYLLVHMPRWNSILSLSFSCPIYLRFYEDYWISFILIQFPLIESITTNGVCLNTSSHNIKVPIDLMQLQANIININMFFIHLHECKCCIFSNGKHVPQRYRNISNNSRRFV